MAKDILEAIADGQYERIEPPPPLPTSAPPPETATFDDWKSHHLSSPQYKLKYFEEASVNFKDRYLYALQGSAFKKILDMLEDKPGQVISNAHDFAQLAVVLQSASENLKLLAAAITTRLTAPPKSSPRRGRQESAPAPYLALTGKPFDDGKEIVEAVFLLTANERHQFLESVRLIGPDRATRIMFEAVLRHVEFMGRNKAVTAKPFNDARERVEAAFVLTADEKRQFMEIVEIIGPDQATRIMLEAVVQHVALM